MDVLYASHNPLYQTAVAVHHNRHLLRTSPRSVSPGLLNALVPQLGAAKEARLREAADLTAQVSALEERSFDTPVGGKYAIYAPMSTHVHFVYSTRQMGRGSFRLAPLDSVMMRALTPMTLRSWSLRRRNHENIPNCRAMGSTVHHMVASSFTCRAQARPSLQFYNLL